MFKRKYKLDLETDKGIKIEGEYSCNIPTTEQRQEKGLTSLALKTSKLNSQKDKTKDKAKLEVINTEIQDLSLKQMAMFKEHIVEINIKVGQDELVEVSHLDYFDGLLIFMQDAIQDVFLGIQVGNAKPTE